MAFGNKEDKQRKKEEEQARKIQKILDKYELGNLSDEYARAVGNISSVLAGNSMIEFGTTLSGKAEDVAKLTYFNALVQQNWILIRQLDEISKKLDKLIEK